MDDGLELSLRARRRRDEAEASAGLSVADLLARHGGSVNSGRSNHRLRGAWDEDESDDPSPGGPEPVERGSAPPHRPTGAPDRNSPANAPGRNNTAGAPGTPGRNASTGANSTVGAPGRNGGTGANGTVGAPGRNGGTGANSTVGTPGRTGGTGANGAVGTPGRNGGTGANGTVGTPGRTGGTGANGTVGAPGRNAGTGANGAVGAPGRNGGTGATSTVGTPGRNAGTGANGTVGAPGRNGGAGANGTVGTPGRNGGTGTAGAAGGNGSAGGNGAPGRSGGPGGSAPKNGGPGGGVTRAPGRPNAAGDRDGDRNGTRAKGSVPNTAANGFGPSGAAATGFGAGSLAAEDVGLNGAAVLHGGSVLSGDPADREPRRALDDVFPARPQAADEEHDHTEQMFGTAGFVADKPLLTVLDRVGLRPVSDYDQPTEITGPPIPADPDSTAQFPVTEAAPEARFVGDSLTDTAVLTATEAAPEAAPKDDTPPIDKANRPGPGRDPNLSATRRPVADLGKPTGLAEFVATPAATEPPEQPEQSENAAKAEQPDAADKAGKSGDPDAAPVKDSVAARTAKIDQTLSRLTAIHAGLGDDMADRVSRSEKLRAVERSGRSRAEDRSSRTKAAQRANRPRAEAADGSANGNGSRAGSSADAPGGPPGRGGPAFARFWSNRPARISTVAAVALLLALVAGGFGGPLWLNSRLRTVSAVDPSDPSVINAAGQSGDQNYLLLGADAGQPAQTVTLAHLPAAADRVVLLGLPTNLLVDRPSCDRYDLTTASYPGGSVPGQSGVPLATAFQLGGPKCLVSAVQRLTGLALNHFVQLEPTGLRPMVDAVHGVPICVANRVDDGALGAVVPSPGQQVMSGDQAQAFATARQVRGEPTDGSGLRMRQQRMLTALLGKAGEFTPLTSFGTLNSLAGALGANALVDSTSVSDLRALGSALTSTDQNKVDYVSVPTADEPDTQGNQVLRPDAAKALFDAMRADQAPRGEGANDPLAGNDTEAYPSGPAPSAVKVSVRNGSGHAGMAGQVADSLRTVGFTVAGVGDAPHLDGGKSVIRASADQAASAAVLSRAVPDAAVKTVPGNNVLELVLGDSFSGQVQAAPPAAPSSPTLVTAAELACH
ncbi:MAG TPA: LCP family protein [Pseudonocardia sp.]